VSLNSFRITGGNFAADTSYNVPPSDNSTAVSSSSSSSSSKGISKAVPLQAWIGSEGSRKLRFPDFMTTAQDSGKVVSLTHRPPLPRGILLVHISNQRPSDM